MLKGEQLSATAGKKANAWPLLLKHLFYSSLQELIELFPYLKLFLSKILSIPAEHDS